VNLTEFADYQDQLDVLLLHCAAICAVAFGLKVDCTETMAESSSASKDIGTFSCQIRGRESSEQIDVCLGRTADSTPVVTLATTRIDPITLPTKGNPDLDMDDIRRIVIEWMFKIAAA
jgi:hypothetical protein